MKKQLIILLLAIFGFAMQANATASAYTIDDEAVEAVLDNAVQVNALAALPVADVTGTQAVLADGASPTVAFLLATFFGGLGAHRWYLGTDSSTKILYCVTLGGCGIVALGDWVLLLIGLINDDIDQYIENDSFIMW